jgi:hypothetical protein
VRFVLHDDYGFRSLNSSYEWTSGLNFASCNASQFMYIPTVPLISIHSEKPPLEGCACGFYAFKSLSKLLEQDDHRMANMVIVIIEAFGKVILHDEGFRAEAVLSKYTVYPVSGIIHRLIVQSSGNTNICHTQNYEVPISLDIVRQCVEKLGVQIVSQDVASNLLENNHLEMGWL